ncbi:altronate oxidoreductase [Paenibacillus sp. BIHB 4019]|uniref:Altronate oxidoreductase n=1 Tax=Paenibacillus sp. BIHB 4019 TaxID=1870819 RepID=A0A1B2DI09_9BACL|nr:tagaturonate reductase [Paenibacillus sp. BIHB 4019]ANY67374.1 altronate oxidoreductase [Paenibacillus sp. BIHB 4019]
MSQLNKSLLGQEDRERYEAVQAGKITVLQIGEGNFLRGFADWMLQECHKQGLFSGGVAVTQPRPGGKPKIDALAKQDGLYTLVIRGLENGAAVQRKEVVTVFAKAFDPYSEWEALVQLAESKDLRFVVSNTTEAGLAYRPEPLQEGQPVQSYPGKLAYLLYRRFLAFEGAADSGLICLPCELLERNGDELKACVLRYSEDWGFPQAFKEWVEQDNRFLNSLVDRIVTGYPDEQQAQQWFEEWGYEDPMLTTAEPYHFWAIEAEPELDEQLPLRRAGLNVHFVEDLKPFQLRKVRILNGAHTLMTPLALVHGLEQVREVMEHAEFGPYVRDAVEQEIIPALPLPEGELKDYAAAVYERFLNPFIRHRLADIAMNSISKFKVRLLPSLLDYADRGQPVPARLVRAFAGLLRYYKVESDGSGAYTGTDLLGTVYTVRDDAGALAALAAAWASEGTAQGAEAAAGSAQAQAERLLALSELWGRDLQAVPGLAEAVASQLEELERGAHE